MATFKNNLMLIGCGPHAHRIYLPLIQKYKDKFDIILRVVVEVESKKKETIDYFSTVEIGPELYFIENDSEREFVLSKKDYGILKDLVHKNNINAIILSTDPLAHKAYLNFALEEGIHVLTDKPITTQVNASIDVEQAKKIMEDYRGLVEKYKLAEKRFPNLIVSCLSQRRYHPAVNRIKSELERVYQRTNCPVTSIMCQHSDGQWRMPNEVIDFNYHGYKNGIGKCSHSGYHFFDIMFWYTQITSEKEYDQVNCYANFIRPMDWISQITIVDYKKIFGNSYSNNLFNINHDDFIEKTKEYGEIDAHINVSLMKKKMKMTNISFSLLHNGFSKRSWINTKSDLYKGNGRIRHETHIIHQGPFQALYYVSYQSDQIENDILKGSGLIGGELHSDVYIFRNSKALGVDLPEFELIQFGKVNERGLEGYSRGHQEDARGTCFCEFMMAVNGEIPKGKLKSSLEQHEGSVLLMSLAYLAAAKEYQQGIPLSSYQGGKLQ